MHLPAFAASLSDNAEKKPVVITSQTLTANNNNNTAIFEGSVVAKTDDVTMYSDKMTVFYDNSESKVKKIHANGNVKVVREEKALFSNEAIYIEEEEKIIFTGNPKAVDGENVISGTQIIFYLKDDRAEVKSSRVVLQNKQGLK
jgi:lipopolysaccharide export system protein LptA